MDGRVSATLLDVAAARRRFTALDRRLAFFDGPGGTQCPDEVIDAIAGYLREDNANVGAPYETSRRTDEVVEGHRIGCSHFDAFRFFTPPARPLNTLQPGRDDRPAFEQPG